LTFDLVEHIRHHGFKCLLLAVSGGLDSICLAHYFIENCKALGIEWLGIAHVHHGLREGTADRDAKFVEEFAKSHNIPFFLKKLDGEALKDAEGSLEENARDARYKALVEIALNKKWRSRNGVRDDIEEGCVTIAIVTAHHAGDQAETMYMRLRRGTTLAGLRGIQEVREIQDDKISLNGAKPQLFGSVMPMQAWAQLSPSE
jgi:tRNA(Ile)-lysidine synthase